MSKPIFINFEFGDGTVHDAGVSEVSQAYSICFRHIWSLIPISVGLGGGATPAYSIEVSNDEVNWAPYSSETDGAGIDQPFEDDHWGFSYVRINYDAKTNTNGTVEFEMRIN